MAYTDKKVPELRHMCLARGLATSGTKNILISRLEKLEQQLQGENYIKQEKNEMQMDVPVIQQQQEIVASPHVSEAGPTHETLSNMKYECEHTNDLLQSMTTEEIPVEELYLPLERHDMPPPNVDMSNEYPQSIDPVEQQQQQQTDQPPTESSIVTSPIVTHDDVSAVEASNDFDQNKHDQPKPFDSSEKTYTTYQRDDSHYEIDRELLTRLISERKNGTQHLNTPKMFSRGIMMNQGQANGVPYNYDLLLDIVQKSEIYKDGEIPNWLRYDYDTTFGSTYFGEPECVRDIGIPVEELFLAERNIVIPAEELFLIEELSS